MGLDGDGFQSAAEPVSETVRPGSKHVFAGHRGVVAAGALGLFCTGRPQGYGWLAWLLDECLIVALAEFRRLLLDLLGIRRTGWQ